MNMQIAQMLAGGKKPRKSNPIAEMLMAKMGAGQAAPFSSPQAQPAPPLGQMQGEGAGGMFAPPSELDPREDYLREEMGEDEYLRYKRMSPMDQQRFMQDPANGFAPPQQQKQPDPMEQYGPMGPMELQLDTKGKSFDDARAYKTADIAGIDANRIAAQPAMGGDAVQSRRLADDEIAYRDAMNGLSGVLEEIQTNPDLLDSAHTWTGRGATGLLRLRDRSGVDAFELSPEEEQRLGDTTAYKQELLTRVNQYIKDITGAQVGQGQETERLMAVQANEGDSPTQVVAKITNALNLARLDIARRNYMQRAGGDAPTDKELREILKGRGKELYDTAISSGMSPNEARMKAAADLSQEFGL